MNLKLKEALGFLGVGILIFLLAFYFIEYVFWVIEVTMYILSIILFLAGLGILSDYINKKNINERNN